MPPAQPATEAIRVGRYLLMGELASGGMATVHLGRLLGAQGFQRVVAVKRLHPQYAKDPRFAERFVEEAQLAAAVQHPNVIPTLDVVAEGDELFLVMEYVRGETLSRLLRSERKPSPDVISAIFVGVLHGLHAAHDAVDSEQRPLGIVHRDVSPQNIIVGTDGVARVLDFGIAKAVTTSAVTEDGQLRGKLRYMSPEQCLGRRLDRRADLFAAGIVLWEALTGRSLFDGDEAPVIIRQVLEATIPAPSTYRTGLQQTLDAVVMRALSRDPEQRFRTAREMALALESAQPPASALRVSEFVLGAAREDLSRRASLVEELESTELDGAESKTLPTIVGARQVGAKPEPAEPRRSRRTLAFVLVAVGVVAVLAILLGYRAPSDSESESTASSLASPAPPPIQSRATTPSRAPEPPTPPVQATAQRAATRIQRVQNVAEKPAVAASSAKPAPRPDCTPPYTIDSHGDKHYKRECL